MYVNWEKENKFHFRSTHDRTYNFKLSIIKNMLQNYKYDQNNLHTPHNYRYNNSIMYDKQVPMIPYWKTGQELNNMNTTVWTF